MKCDELKAEQWLDYSGEPMPCYPKAKVDAAIEELKAENAELKKKCEAEKSIGATFSENGAELARWVEELRKENESLKYSVATLETDLAMATRWRKCSEEMPKDGETVLVLLGRTPKTRGFFLTSRYVAGEWTYGEDPQDCKPTHWFRIPKVPEAK